MADYSPALVGFHPWRDPVELFERYLYQDLDCLLALDAKNLNMSFTTKEDELQAVVSKLDSNSREELKRIEEKIQQENNNNEDAQLLLQEIAKVVEAETKKKTLSKAELDLLDTELSGKVRKEYGNHCENKSLDIYEQVTGCEVVERNAKTLYMDVFPEPESFFQPVSVSNKRRKIVKGKLQPLFQIIGRIDGLAKHIDMTDEDASKWKTVDVVVEMKSRVRRISNPPPIYELVQLVAYMKILNCTYGDLVQSIYVPPHQSSRTINRNGVVTNSKIADEESILKTDSLECNDCIESMSLNRTDDGVRASSSSMETKRNIIESTETEFMSESAFVLDGSQLIDSADSKKYATSTDICGIVCSVQHCETIKGGKGRTLNATRESDNAKSSSDTVSLDDFKEDIVSSDFEQPQSQQVLQTIHSVHSHSSAADNLHVYRVDLHDSNYQHNKNWAEVVLPRLRIFHQCIMDFREDDSKRYNWLLSTLKEKEILLYDMCKYFAESQYLSANDTFLF